MVIRRLFPAIAWSALLCTQALAAEPGFSFIELGAIKAGHHGNGAGVRASGALGQHAVVYGNLDAYSFYNGSIVVSSLGGGMQWSAMPSLRGMAGLSAEILGGSYDDHDDGGVEGLALGIGAGALLRGRAGDRLELEAGLKYVHIVSERAAGKLQASGALRYHLSPRAALGLEVGNDYFGFRAGLVARFDLRRR